MKAAKLFVVVREFRGALLFLVSVQRSTLAFEWSADSARARRFESMAGAMAAASLALNEYGANVTVRDSAGCLAQPAGAVNAEPVGVARASEFRRLVTAAQSERGPHCGEHAAFTDGCSACYSVHADRSAA